MILGNIERKEQPSQTDERLGEVFEHEIARAVWNIRCTHVGDRPAKFKKVGTTILVQCDRPAVFFLDRDQL